METLSVVVSVRNAQKNIERCLSSVSWADEIVVVDNESSDETAGIAKKFTRNIFHQKNNLMLNTNKNFGFTKAHSDWVLSLDDDEEIPKNTADEMKEILKNPQASVAGYWIERKNIIFGKWIQHGLWWPDKQLRLFRRGWGKFPCKHVHEYLTVDGRTGQLDGPFIHYNYESISQYIRKMNDIYTENEVENLVGAGYKVGWFDAIRFPVSDFVKIFFAQDGYKDGLHGLVLSMLQAFYSLVVFAKLWERQSFVQMDIPLPAFSREFTRSAGDLRYWIFTARILQTQGKITRLLLRVRRRFTRWRKDL